MTIKIKMEVTEEEAIAVIRHHSRVLRDYAYGELHRAERVHDIVKRILRAKKQHLGELGVKPIDADISTEQPENEQAPIAAAWPNS